MSDPDLIEKGLFHHTATLKFLVHGENIPKRRKKQHWKVYHITQ